MIVMGIDQSLSDTGYAVIDYKSENEYEYLEIGHINLRSSMSPEDRMNYIASSLMAKAIDNGVDYIAMEELMTPRINSMNTIKVLCGLFYVIMCKFIRSEYLIVTAYPSEWKKKIGVEGKNRKEQKASSIKVANSLLKRGENVVDNDNVADAICIAKFGAMQDLEVE